MNSRDRRPRLFTPGPVEVHPAVRTTADFVLHHRSERFRRDLSKVRIGLQGLFRTSGEVAILASSGTGAMEAAVANLVSQGDRTLVIRSGKYGERWGEICNVYRAQVEWLEVEPGSAVDPGEVAGRLESGEITAVFLVHVETSTGALNDVETVARAVGGRAALVVDVISSLGVHEFEMDAWGVDLAVAASQKALGLPPGLGLVAVGSDAQARIEASNSQRFYFDLRKYLSSGARDETPFTAPVTLVAALGSALEDSGNPAESIARHARFAGAFRAGVEALGLELFPADPCDAVTVVRVPEYLDAERLIRILEEEQGVRVAAGQGVLRNRVVRLGHLGRLEEADVTTLFEALEQSLPRCAHPVEPGKSVEAVRGALAGSEEGANHGS